MTPPLVYTFDVTVPAGTPAAAPLVTLTQFEPNIVESVSWLFPDGCNGLVGMQIGARSVAVIPHGPEMWFIRSGDSQGFDLSGMPDGGDWSVIAYNLGAYSHTIHVAFKVTRKRRKQPPPLLIASAPVLMYRGES